MKYGVTVERRVDKDTGYIHWRVDLYTERGAEFKELTFTTEFTNRFGERRTVLEEFLRWRDERWGKWWPFVEMQIRALAPWHYTHMVSR